ncbi:eukaryotic translation initiation factor 4E-binding protein 1 [Orussus abietinus]|uniref:eukaryotic translation initiation factor 4E-binding protein 1 n=1 Tax=Orussus abietinus TaxID=222816 RepID=UPI0006254ABC|nr:eukaryotic translation initiation factor 4E-binding protein 1 [Orussus abietinus]XP_012278960.1 eukaryotic translation initiation factor 4E-binding protein 1 [Orussus abietinus]XP_012278961.1 eukaryotic translation initiation factor 4E-binding protein 1 [Orussus abietinus]XP_012278962.1 eukaryotic translation initiation factor 4E-binding protein 1 [Orussus abietinus]XP_012278964.1 eukaryotic translation initiation factor 4E-binding protein 1 [Orussus abietinus]XP_012278965.1 eukaryotic tran
MSASPITRQVTQSQTIPSRRVAIHDPSEFPTDYSSTPGGTIYSTTPGGTRIVYDHAFLMNLRNSPISQSPPRNMPSIPANILKDSPLSLPTTMSPTVVQAKKSCQSKNSSQSSELPCDCDNQFVMTDCCSLLVEKS